MGGRAIPAGDAPAQPLVSVIIPTRDRRTLLRQTLASVQAQTYPRWEALIVDDGSTDGTPAMVEALAAQDERIRYLARTGTRTGAPVCRNRGVAASRGAYVVFLDSDDCLARHCLAQRVEVMEASPGLDFGVFPCQLFREAPGDMAVLWNVETAEEDLDRFLRVDVPWQTTSPMWRREALEKQGGWDENLPSWQDWDYHFRAVLNGLSYAWFGSPDCYWRVANKNVHAEALTRRTIGGTAGSLDHLKIRERLHVKTHRLLEAAGLLNERRRQLLAALFLWLAAQWALHGSQRQAYATWSTCRSLQLVDETVYRQGILYLRTRRIPYVGGLVRRYLTLRWPSGLLWQRSATFRKAPLSALVQQDHREAPVDLDPKEG